MVINSLTDGKSSHIPYRDSKLTRILQESLGGNSRTTLIINCSPSSYNEAETISTLRFGMRAKSIKNKAKVNADLSPAELKALLKKVKSETITFQAYIAALEGEVTVWRGGNTLPEDKWVSMDKINKGDYSALPPASNFRAASVAEDASRPTTPSVVLEKDEREELLKRENELMDQIAEKETELANREKLLESLKEEMGYYKEQEAIVTKENQQMTSELSELRLQLQKISYESKENAINVDSLKEANQELIAELEELKKNLQEVRLAHKDSNDNEKEKKKAQKLAQIMFKLDPSVGFICLFVCAHVCKCIMLYNAVSRLFRVRLTKKNVKFVIRCTRLRLKAMVRLAWRSWLRCVVIWQSPKSCWISTARRSLTFRTKRKCSKRRSWSWMPSLAIWSKNTRSFLIRRLRKRKWLHRRMQTWKKPSLH